MTRAAKARALVAAGLSATEAAVRLGVSRQAVQSAVQHPGAAGRPRKGRTRNLRVTTALYERLRALAERDDCSISDTAERLLTTALPVASRDGSI